jgi:hypothetical protein
MRINAPEIVKQSYVALFNNRTLLILVVAWSAIVGVLPSLFISVLFQSIGIVGTAIVIVAVFLLAEAFITGTIISATSMGSGATLEVSAKNAASRYVSLLGTSILSGILGLLALMPGIALMIVGIASMVYHGPLALLTLVGVALVIMPGAYVSLRLSLSSVACVAGGKRAVESVKNSWSITKGSLWGMCGISMTLGITATLIGRIVVFLNDTVGSFVSVFLSYVFIIALVIIYQTLLASPPAEPPAQSSTEMQTSEPAQQDQP